MDLKTTLDMEDLEPLVELARAFIEESIYASEGFDEVSVRRLFEATIHKPSEFAVFYLKEDGVIQGFYLMGIASRFFNKCCYAADLGVYLRPEIRGRYLSVRMVVAAEKWAKQHGAESLYMGISAGINVERTERLYSLFGYTKACLTFKKEL